MKRFWFFALLTAVSLMCWGSKSFAQEVKDINLGNGAVTPVVTPVPGKPPVGRMPSPPGLQAGKSLKVDIHGFVEFDAINYDTHTFTEVAGRGPVKAPGTAAGDNGCLKYPCATSRLSFWPPRRKSTDGRPRKISNAISKVTIPALSIDRSQWCPGFALRSQLVLLSNFRHPPRLLEREKEAGTSK